MGVENVDEIRASPQFRGLDGAVSNLYIVGCQRCAHKTGAPFVCPWIGLAAQATQNRGREAGLGGVQTEGTQPCKNVWAFPGLQCLADDLLGRMGDAVLKRVGFEGGTQRKLQPRLCRTLRPIPVPALYRERRRLPQCWRVLDSAFCPTVYSSRQKVRIIMDRSLEGATGVACELPFAGSPKFWE